MNPRDEDFRSTEARVAQLAARQLGLVTRAQVAALGVGPNAILRRVRSGAWERMLPKVYRVASVAPSGRQAALAAILWAGPGAAVSHAAAGVLWGIAGVRAARVELWIPPTRRLRSDLVVVHRGVVSGRDHRIIEGFPVTSPARTVIDLASRLDDEALDAVIDDVLHRCLTTPGALRGRAVAVAERGRAGSGRVQKLLDNRGGGPAAESRLETRVRRLLRGAGLRPVGQHDVIAAGRRYRLDFACPNCGSR